MIGLVLVTHGRLAAEFVAAMEHVVGPQTQIGSVCIGPDDDIEQRRKDILETVQSVDSGQGVIILTDLILLPGFDESKTYPAITRCRSSRNTHRDLDGKLTRRELTPRRQSQNSQVNS